MLPLIRAATAIALVISLLPSAADAGRKQRQSWDDIPLKDCTRLNGRYGYYGNPWCTPAEQKRWDRWQAQRVKVR